MKNIIAYFTFILCLLMVGQVYAQQTDSIDLVKPDKQVEDRYVNENKRYKPVKRDKVFAPDSVKVYLSSCSEAQVRSWDAKRWWKRGHWAGVGIGYNGLISNLGHLSVPSEANYLSLKSKSITVMVNPIDFSIVSGRNWSLLSGLGFEFNNFNFDRNITLTSYNGQIAPDLTYVADGTVLKKTKLVTAYLNVPLLMEFRFGGYRGGFINFGVIGGWRMQSHTKIKGDLPGKNTIKEKNSQHLKNFHYGVTASGGYHNVGLYVTYYPQSIFRNGEGPHVEQVNLGVAILL